MPGAGLYLTFSREWEGQFQDSTIVSNRQSRICCVRGSSVLHAINYFPSRAAEARELMPPDCAEVYDMFGIQQPVSDNGFDCGDNIHLMSVEWNGGSKHFDGLDAASVG